MAEIPNVIVNGQNGHRFLRGQFLGKGGFARCYELKDEVTKQVFAGKVVPKALLHRRDQREKIGQEIKIHSALHHPNIVKLEGFFEDDNFVYVLLELCSSRSLLELHKRRKKVTEPEARYFLAQIINACEYLHSRNIIHRDLKLGNLFLTKDMTLKIGDFGLATVLRFNGERKRAMCGTPNYIAPEVLLNQGHSFEADVWAIGCILYTLLVGKPPFETNSLKKTYEKIKRNEYDIPASVGADASFLIRNLLAPDPERRPKVTEIVGMFDFFKNSFTPSRLPASCLTTTPKLRLSQLSQDEHHVMPSMPSSQQSPSATLGSHQGTNRVDTGAVVSPEVDSSFLLQRLHEMVVSLLSKRLPHCRRAREEEALDPASSPVYWVSKWVDYSPKYGLSYALPDKSIGVAFNDASRMLIDAAKVHVQYTAKSGEEQFFEATSSPASLHKKMTLLWYFSNYMDGILRETRAGGAVRRAGDELARRPFLRRWFRTINTIVFQLSNGIVQINFLEDHTKMILCPLMAAVTYVDTTRSSRTFKLALLERFGCTDEVLTRLRYASVMMEKLLSRAQASAGVGSQEAHEALPLFPPAAEGLCAAGPLLAV